MKSVIAAGLLLGIAHGTAIAAPYVNVESNSGWSGSNYQATSIETHFGFGGDLSETTSAYIQAGPAFINAEGVDSETEISGKAGLGVDLSEKLNLYGELSFLTEDRSFEEDLNLGLKAGATYTF
jgi:hypothetical protein